MALGSIFEVVGAFIGCEGVECLAYCGADRIDGSRGSLSEQVLELGKDLFDRVQVGRVFWQEEELGADRTDELADCFAPVAAEISGLGALKTNPAVSVSFVCIQMLR